ncbi:putative polyubiquitin-A-like [Triplophysa rosa]|uniref:Polyubiquitin-A-like n=1 Tax=Triplophysa rosa TaxID=992332 RepID=A0A9W7WSY0_TRIRA|nr:putative polyubiquitin-A-like [Triplophysa rosa]
MTTTIKWIHHALFSSSESDSAQTVGGTSEASKRTELAYTDRKKKHQPKIDAYNRRLFEINLVYNVRRHKEVQSIRQRHQIGVKTKRSRFAVRQYVTRARMAFQVRIRINKNAIKILSVATSSDEFEKFTIGMLKEKALNLFPGVDDPGALRVIFGQNEPEDDETFESCNIEHLSVLVVVLIMPGGVVLRLRVI